MERFHQLLALMASSPVLDASTQHRLALVGEQAKSSSGDRILVELARRAELAPQARGIVEASGRAAARTDTSGRASNGRSG